MNKITYLFTQPDWSKTKDISEPLAHQYQFYSDAPATPALHGLENRHNKGRSSAYSPERVLQAETG